MTEAGILLRARRVAGAEVTLMEPDVELSAPDETVMVCVPTVLRVAWKLAVPLVSGLAVGRVEFESVEVKPTVPLKLVAMLPFESTAVRVKLNEFPAVAVTGT